MILSVWFFFKRHSLNSILGTNSDSYHKNHIHTMTATRSPPYFQPPWVCRPHLRLLSVRPYSQPLQGSCTRTVTVSPGGNGRSFGLDEEGWCTRALMGLPPLRPRDSPTELERERLGRGDGAGPIMRSFIYFVLLQVRGLATLTIRRAIFGHCGHCGPTSYSVGGDWVTL